jgi:hypothetical protein
MPPDQSFKAIVNLNNAPGEIEHLKRLALIFDEIYYIYPQLYCLEDLSLDKAIGFQFDLFRDCVVYDVITLEDLQQTLFILEDAKIAKGISARDETLKDLRRDIAIIDEKDPEFHKLTPNSPGSVLPFRARYSTGPDKGRQTELVAVNPSMAIWDSLILTNTLFLANKESLFPVFLEPRHRREMEYRYNQYRQASSKIALACPNLVSPVNFETQFGEVTFSIFNGVWPHELMINKSLEEIIRYRDNMAPARKKYIASLTELADIAENNPWNQKTKDEAKKYLLKLEADLVNYRQEAENICTKMFDDLKGHTVGVTMKGAGWGIAGAVTGSGLSAFLAPEIASWGLMLAGVLTGSSRTIAQSVKTYLDCRRAQAEHKKSGLAYVAEFN